MSMLSSTSSIFFDRITVGNAAVDQQRVHAFIRHDRQLGERRNEGR